MLEWLLAGFMPTVSFILSEPPSFHSLLVGRPGVFLYELIRGCAWNPLSIPALALTLAVAAAGEEAEGGQGQHGGSGRLGNLGDFRGVDGEIIQIKMGHRA